MEERCKRAVISTYNFIDEELSEFPYLLNKVKKWNDIINIYTSGHVIEFGVYQGHTISHLANMFPERTIHGFDTFEGLPEDWSHAKKGAFDMQGKLTQVPKYVVLHKGLFDTSLVK